jgi:hypothetical protein
MTPKEKAEELLWQYSRALQIWDLENSLIAIKCALIAVDEIIDYLTSNKITGTLMTYWQEVKREIKKL